MIAVSGPEGGCGGGCTPLLYWGCSWGVVLRVLLWFGGFFWFVLVLFCYCSATVLLGGLLDVVSGCFSGSFRCLAVFSCVDA